MSIELFVDALNPGISWEDFNKFPKYSIALDGFVKEGPAFDSKKIVANFNHHEGVDRLATRATCAQILMAIRQDLFSTFRNEKGVVANVWVNDCDEDVCTAWFLLKNHYLVKGTMNPAINRLVAMEDVLDATAGAYPFPSDLSALQELAWVFEPYRTFRLGGNLEKRDSSAFKSIICDVENRILLHIIGRGNNIPLDTRYEVMDSGSGWSMVREIGAHARTGMFADGIKAFVSVKDRQDGKWGYTIGKLSPFIPFDLIKLTETLNKIDSSNGDNWGGGNNIMGSPRVKGSSISPKELFEIVVKN